MVTHRKLRRLVGWTTVSIVVAVLVVSSGVPRTLLAVDNEEMVRFLWEEQQQHLQEALARAEGPLQADDPQLIWLLRRRYLDPPSPGPRNLMADHTGPTAKRYNLYKTTFNSWIRTNTIVKRLFSDAPPGFFLEAGALDGEFISNTLFLERELGWTGLLVEADSILYADIPGKRRNAWASHSCLSLAPYAQKLTFEAYHADAWASIDTRLLVRSTGNLADVIAPAAGQMGTKERQKVQCFPLYSYLLALNVTSVQYLSLDVEGAEADILLSFPWEKANVTVWSIEHRPYNSHFRDLYSKPHETPSTTPQAMESRKKPTLHKQDDAASPRVVIQVEKRVVYTNQHDPAAGKDDYFVRFMTERGYVLYDYWDGDYTFIKRNSSICDKHCPVL
ncbi:uncharacterized protein [Procambarus clarkii]|uniref:uncharacterized protein n=1 Tax=Procambarus clarkii TaxID=6728 RepID=UPI0037429C84